MTDRKKEIKYKLSKLDRLLYYVGDRTLILTGVNSVAIPDLKNPLYPNVHQIYSEIESILKQPNISKDDEKELVKKMNTMTLCLSGYDITTDQTINEIDNLATDELKDLEIQVDRYLEIKKLRNNK